MNFGDDDLSTLVHHLWQMHHSGVRCGWWGSLCMCVIRGNIGTQFCCEPKIALVLFFNRHTDTIQTLIAYV